MTYLLSRFIAPMTFSSSIAIGRWPADDAVNGALIRAHSASAQKRASLPPLAGANPVLTSRSWASSSIGVMKMRVLIPVLVLLFCATADRPAWSGPPTEVLTVSGFGQVSVYAPSGTPSEVVLFISGDGGWNLGVVPMAEALRDRGALVVGVDIRAFVKGLDASNSCAYPAGDLERLSRTVQLKRGLPEYKPPILVGYSSGATLVYAALAAAPAETFAGAISLGFCPDLEITRSPCQQNGLMATRRKNGPGFDLAPNHQIRTPWMVLQGDIDQVCAPAVTQAFVADVPGAKLFSLPKVGHGFAVPRNWEPQYLAAYDAIAAKRAKSEPLATAPEVRDLSLTEVPVAPPSRTDTMAIILTGDGGWAGLDKSVAAGLAARGVPSVGWSSLRYYWTPRTPDGAAADLGRIIRHYMSEWAAERVILVGYSFGADVLPFLVNRLPAPVQSHVGSVVLLGLSQTADFEFHLSDWIGHNGASQYRTVPEAERLAVHVLCVQGADEDDSACRILKGAHITSLEVGHGHHFSGDYAQLVDVILNRTADRTGGTSR
jgi:type IV secretory pathway VirJ component